MASPLPALLVAVLLASLYQLSSPPHLSLSLLSPHPPPFLLHLCCSRCLPSHFLFPFCFFSFIYLLTSYLFPLFSTSPLLYPFSFTISSIPLTFTFLLSSFLFSSSLPTFSSTSIPSSHFFLSIFVFSPFSSPFIFTSYTSPFSISTSFSSFFSYFFLPSFLFSTLSSSSSLLFHSFFFFLFFLFLSILASSSLLFFSIPYSFSYPLINSSYLSPFSLLSIYLISALASSVVSSMAILGLSAVRDPPTHPAPSRTLLDAYPHLSAVSFSKSSSVPSCSLPSLFPQNSSAPSNLPTSSLSLAPPLCPRNIRSAANVSRYLLSARVARTASHRTSLTAALQARLSSLLPTTHSASVIIDAPARLPTPCARSTIPLSSPSAFSFPSPYSDSTNNVCGYLRRFFLLTQIYTINKAGPPCAERTSI